jgi:hypothetical protein
MTEQLKTMELTESEARIILNRRASETHKPLLKTFNLERSKLPVIIFFGVVSLKMDSTFQIVAHSLMSLAIKRMTIASCVMLLKKFGS